MTERLGAPPNSLPELLPDDVFQISAGQLIGRIYFAGGAHPMVWDAFRRFGPVATMRFDHHPPPPRVHLTRGIAYAAPSAGRQGPNDPLSTCLVECFSSTRIIDTRYNEPWFVLWRAQRPIPLLDVVDSTWIVRASGNGAISSGSRAAARQWSRVIYRAYTDLAGILYQSSNLPRARCAALYERAQSALPDRYDTAFPLTHPNLRAPLRRIASEFDYDLVL